MIKETKLGEPPPVHAGTTAALRGAVNLNALGKASQKLGPAL